VTSESGAMEFLSVSKSGLSSGNEFIAETLRADRTLNTSSREIECVSLDTIFSQLGREDVHWLKIDVEGSELEVLESWGASHSRPWIVIVEATIPQSSVLGSNVWEKYLFERNYLHAYFDGLNKFYVHKLHEDLIESIQSPISIFDDVITFENHTRIESLQKLYEVLESQGLNLEEEFIGQPKVDLLAKEIKQLIALKTDHETTIANLRELIDDRNKFHETSIVNLQNLTNNYASLVSETQKSLSDVKSEIEGIKQSKIYRVSGPLRFIYSKILNFSIKENIRAFLLKIVARILSSKKLRLFLTKNISPKTLLKIRNKIYVPTNSIKSPKDSSLSELLIPELEQILQDFQRR
jgi:hypothetical protein